MLRHEPHRYVALHSSHAAVATQAEQVRARLQRSHGRAYGFIREVEEVRLARRDGIGTHGSARALRRWHLCIRT